MGDLEPIRPEYRDRDWRLDTLDAQGVRTAFLLPTLALGIEELLTHDPAGLHGVFLAPSIGGSMKTGDSPGTIGSCRRRL